MVVACGSDDDDDACEIEVLFLVLQGEGPFRQSRDKRGRRVHCAADRWLLELGALGRECFCLLFLLIVFAFCFSYVFA